MKAIGGSPAQVPGFAVRISPCVGVPEIVGAVTIDGGLPTIFADSGLVAVALPSAFVAVTTTRAVEPVSASVGAYVAPVAPGMSAQTPGELQSCHW